MIVCLNFEFYRYPHEKYWWCYYLLLIKFSKNNHLVEDVIYINKVAFNQVFFFLTVLQAIFLHLFKGTYLPYNKIIHLVKKVLDESLNYGKWLTLKWFNWLTAKTNETHLFFFCNMTWKFLGKMFRRIEIQDIGLV